MRPALEHLCGKLWTNDFGLSEISRRLLVRAPWREGSTLRPPVAAETSPPR